MEIDFETTDVFVNFHTMFYIVSKEEKHKNIKEGMLLQIFICHWIRGQLI